MISFRCIIDINNQLPRPPDESWRYGASLYCRLIVGHSNNTHPSYPTETGENELPLMMHLFEVDVLMT